MKGAQLVPIGMSPVLKTHLSNIRYMLSIKTSSILMAPVLDM